MKDSESRIRRSIVIQLVTIPIVLVGFGILTLLLSNVLDRVDTMENPSTGFDVENSIGSVDIDYSDGQNIYVPAYSSIPIKSGGVQNLSIFLSIRNTDPKYGISVKRVDYYDTKGNLVRQFAENELELAPMETREFYIEQNDPIGGSGANFVIQWDADSPVHQPVVEALMYGTVGNRSYEFKSQGLIMK